MAKYSNGLEDKLDISQASVTVLEKRYLTKDVPGNLLETGEDLYRRVARDIACADALYLPEFKGKINPGISTKELYQICKSNEQIEKREQEFFEMMSKNYFLPNSPTLMNAGKKLQQLAACFVLPIEDDMEAIGNAQKNMMLVHKSGGGTGFSFSRLRANGAYIGSTNSYSPGPISFLKSFNATTEIVKQGGKRRGANMAVIRANHPDALCFARIKREEGMIANFNISVAFTEQEIKAIKNDDYILMDDPRKGVEYNVNDAKNRLQIMTFEKDKFKTSWRLSKDEKLIIDNYSEKEIGKVEDNKLYLKAKSLFDVIIEGAWKKGEPGIVFIDRMNKYNPTPELGKIEATNPCGEQPLLPDESCTLGSINLSKMVKKGKINKSRLEKTVRSATRFLDNVIDRNNYPLKEISNITKANRKIGLGIMGFAHMLVEMGISYQSQKAIDTAENVMKFINDVSKKESRKLAEERGSFPNFDKSIYKDGQPIRNATRTTIAPTGTISIIAGASSGVEPIFNLVTLRKVKDTLGEDLVETDKAFKKYLQEKDLYDEDIMRKMEKEGLGIDGLLLPKKTKDEIKSLFVTAHEVSPEQHIKVQAAFQKYTDNAVSKTINMPNETTKEGVAKAYLMADELECKGLTIYRKGSRDFELLTGVEGGLEKRSMENPIQPPNILPSIKVKQNTPFGHMHVHISIDPRRNYDPIETFGSLGNAGDSELSDLEAIGRQTSQWFRSGGSSTKVINQLLGIGSKRFVLSNSGDVTSLPMGFAKALLKYELARNLYPMEDILTGKIDFNELDEKVSKKIKSGDIKINGIKVKQSSITSEDTCSECGGKFMFVEGCQTCSSCGLSKC